MRFNFHVLSLLIFITACSGKPSSNASFQFGVSLENLSASGGLVIFGKSKDASFTRIVTPGPLTMNLPRGSWVFGAMAWDGNNSFKGNITCGLQAAVLNQEKATINLNLTNATCFTSAFSTETGRGTAPNLMGSIPNVEICEGDVSSLTTETCSYNPSSAPVLPTRGFAASYRFVIKGGSSFSKDGNGERLESLCFKNNDTESEDGTTFLNALNIPDFNRSLGIPVEIELYLAKNCDPSRGVLKAKGGDESRLNVHLLSPTNKNVFVRAPIAEICTNSAMLAASDQFSGGRGLNTVPYVICTRDQFNFLQAGFDGASSLFSKSYILATDINLTDFLGGNGDPCLDPGDTFVPFGKFYSNTPMPCTLQDQTNAGLQGNFDGNGHTIHRFRFKDQSSNNIGLFSGVYEAVSNLTLKDAEVEGGDATGAIIGSAFVGSKLYNLKVESSSVRGESYVGGIAGGTSDAAPIINLRGRNVSVEGKAYVGGLIGAVLNASSDISYSSFDGQVYGNGIDYVGGIVGSTMGDVSRSVSSGMIRSSSIRVGGIAGSGVDFLFNRSDMLLVDLSTNNNLFFGGIVGDGNSVASSLFTGNIRSNCASSCKIGGIAGFLVSPSDHSSSMSGGDGDNGTITTLAILYSSITTDLCTNFPGTCGWMSTIGDLPRIIDVDVDHVCNSTLNNLPFSSQKMSKLTRGTEKDPFIICKADQLTGISSSNGEFYSVAQSLNLSSSSQDDYGTFKGTLLGNSRLIHSHTRSTSVSKALFNNIDSGSLVKNLKIAGFKYTSTGCSSCGLAPLASLNSGTVEAVSAVDNYIDTFDNTAKVGGLIATNIGTVAGAKTSGTLKAPAGVGGVVAVNLGTVKDSVSETYSTYSSGSAFLIGGIVAQNSGDVLRNTFKGEIYLPGVSSADSVGGIVGFNDTLAATTHIVDNEVDEDAFMKMPSSATNSGGIVGSSDFATNIIKRNLMKGLIMEPTDLTSVREISGDLLFDDEGDLNYTYTSTQSYQATSTGLSLATWGAGNCDIQVPTSIGGSGGTGAFRINKQNYFGGLAVASTTWTLTIPTDTSTECLSRFSNIGAGIEVYKSYTAVTPPLVSDLKDKNYDVVDLSIQNDLDRTIAAYISLIKTGIATNPPVWMYEDEEGVKLFLNH